MYTFDLPPRVPTHDGSLIPAMRAAQDARPPSATPIYDALYAEFQRLFRTLPGDRSGEEALVFHGFAGGRYATHTGYQGHGSPHGTHPGAHPGAHPGTHHPTHNGAHPGTHPAARGGGNQAAAYGRHRGGYALPPAQPGATYY
ncbi:hypothetical protein [Allostreptomyces psammosilenae]|uniref:Uncharacterized protein n=1 Tax=Allostreptomyces psammosilenae TaxID=1892865 RepID=A0A852ZRB7_9ACTN|nr:hypothetical protein [Allostreptomyces psammosilenae]NYI03404.1 hypothetical protein [Allostreptomyces psammosilenae]